MSAVLVNILVHPDEYDELKHCAVLCEVVPCAQIPEGQTAFTMREVSASNLSAISEETEEECKGEDDFDLELSQSEVSLLKPASRMEKKCKKRRQPADHASAPRAKKARVASKIEVRIPKVKGNPKKQRPTKKAAQAALEANAKAVEAALKPPVGPTSLGLGGAA